MSDDTEADRLADTGLDTPRTHERPPHETVEDDAFDEDEIRERLEKILGLVRENPDFLPKLRHVLRVDSEVIRRILADHLLDQRTER